MTTCKGCGVHLQYENPQLPGYTPKKESEYCQRCFRLIHYDDLTVSMRQGINAEEVMKKIASMDALILWVVDLFDFEAGMVPGLNRQLIGKDIILAAGKRDILPETLSSEKTARFVFGRLREQGIAIRSLILTSAKENQGIEEITDAVRMFAKGRPVVVMGKANSGKSTLLNRLIGDNALTMSRYPGTTLDFNEIDIDGQTYIDTPGLENESSILMRVDEKDLRTIIPSGRIRPTVYQLRLDQSFAIGGLARIDLFGCDHASAVFYISDALKIHRSKVSAADTLWKKHYNELFVPVADTPEFRTFSIHKDMDKMDIVIDGLGWVSVHGQMRNIVVHVPEHVNVTFRKAML